MARIPDQLDTGLSDAEVLTAFDNALNEYPNTKEEVETARGTEDSLDARLDNMDAVIAAAALGIKYKGEVNYYADLPNSAEIGDAYTVKYSGTSGTTPDGTEYVWGAVSGVNQWINFAKDSYSKAEVDALLALKQNVLTTAQLAAVNSGIDSTKVEQIETNKNNILSKAITGTCNTAATTAAKEVSIDGFVLVKGAIIGVKFGNTNSATNVTLNVNGTGAKSIYHNNAVYTGVSYQICGKKNTYTYYMYDGNYWCWLATGENTAPAHLITTDSSTSITITGLDSTYNTNCILLCTDRRTSDAVDSVYLVSRYGTVVRIAVLSGNTSPTATISGDIITISNLRTYQTITVLAAETVGIAVS